MISTSPTVIPTARYELRYVAKALGVAPSTVLRWTRQGKMHCSFRKTNHRRVWTGSEIIRIWKANI